MTTLKGPDHYRYYSDIEDTGVVIRCERFIVVGETECCYYVLSERKSYLLNWAGQEHQVKKHRKRVLKQSRIRHCYPDRREALHSFMLRQSHRLSRVTRDKSMASLGLKEALHLLEAGKLPPDRGAHVCGHDDYTRSLSWEVC